MIISKLQEELERIRQKEGDIEVTCTGSLLPDGECRECGKGDVFETTLENLIVNRNHPRHGKAVRVWM